MTREDALNYIAAEMADSAIRQQLDAARNTLGFLQGVDAFGDEEMVEKVNVAQREVDIISSEEYLVATENLYAEVYDGLEDRFVIRMAEELEYEAALIKIGALNGARLGELVDKFMTGTYKAPTLQ